MGVVHFTVCTPVHNLKSQARDTASEIHGISLHCIGIEKLMYELTTHFHLQSTNFDMCLLVTKFL